MAKLSAREIMDSVKEMTVLEVFELVNLMKEELGVDPSAVAVAAPSAGAAVEEGPSTKTVVLKNAGTAKIQIIKIIREITGLGLVEAKGIADNGGNVKENISTEEAKAIQAQLEEAGATVELA